MHQLAHQTISSRARPESRWLTRWFTAARREGFFALLSPEDWHTLCAVLSFVSRDSQCVFTVDQLANATGQSRLGAVQRIQSLASVSWRDNPLITIHYDAADELAGAGLAPVEVLNDLAPPAEETTPTNDLSADLIALGLSPAQASALQAGHSEDQIRQQLSWLPRRDARNPAALLIRAVEGNWDEPKETA